jgi:hypothetical protein
VPSPYSVDTGMATTFQQNAARLRHSTETNLQGLLRPGSAAALLASTCALLHHFAASLRKEAGYGLHPGYIWDRPPR